MKNLAAHMRISGVTVTDSEVESRRYAASSLAAKWGKISNVDQIAEKAGFVALALSCDGTPAEVLVDEVQALIQKKSSAYLASERPFDVGICCGMAMVSLFEEPLASPGWTIKEVYAASLWSALAYQSPIDVTKREELRVEVLTTASAFSTTHAEKARTRNVVPDPSATKLKVDETNLVDFDLKTMMSKTIESLRNNAILDREELDFLWWAQLGRSRLLKKQLSNISEPTRIVAAGIEGAKMLRRLPCEVHREIVLRTLDKDPELNLAELLSDLGDERQLLSEAISTERVILHPVVFPLLHSIYTGELDNFGSSVKRRVSEWGARALLEATLARLMSQGVSKV